MQGISFPINPSLICREIRCWSRKSLFFLAFFPQFIDKGIENPIPQMLLLGLVFMVQAFLIFSMVAAVADRLARRLMQNPKVALAVNVAESLIYCVIGVSILFVR